MFHKLYFVNPMQKKKKTRNLLGQDYIFYMITFLNALSFFFSNIGKFPRPLKLIYFFPLQQETFLLSIVKEMMCYYTKHLTSVILSYQAQANLSPVFSLNSSSLLLFCTILISSNSFNCIFKNLYPLLTNFLISSLFLQNGFCISLP